MHIRNVLAVIVIAVLLALSVVPVMADTSGVTGVVVNNQKVTSNTPPVISNGVLLVPAKEFVTALGGSFSYDNTSLAASIKLGENELVFRLDNNIAKLNGKFVQAPGSMIIANNRFMIPVQFVAEKLGAEVYISTGKNLIMVFQPVGGKLVYQVMSGDSLWIISQLFRTTVDTLKQMNNLTSDTIFIGQQLTIKSFTSFSAAIPAQTSNSATLFSGAGFGYSVVGYLQSKTSISVVGKNGNWYKVTTPKGNGYLYYTVVGITQDTVDSASDSTYFNSQIAVDTSKDSITYNSYTVQSGDYIWSLAQKFSIPDYELSAANNILSASSLIPGQVLTIPVHNIPVKSTTIQGYGEILDWFKEGQYLFPIGKAGKFTDLQTGKSFMAKRTIGANHSDTETLTAQDTASMKDIFGGSWIWKTRPFILEVDGRQFAVSVAGMPHAGVDGAPFLANVDNRSDNWGSGPNYDSISGNGMDGHFDVYFLNSLRHVDNKIEPQHQYNILTAGGLQ